MRIWIAKDYDGMCQNGANLIAAEVLLKPDCVLGLATGSTPCGIYDRLAEKYSAGELDFAAVRSVNLDEYVGLSPENDQSYRYCMQKNLFSRINIRPENTHVPNGLAEDIEKECQRYEQQVAAYGYPDLQLLGIGLNGHIGFNEPGEDFPAVTHRVSLTESTINANSRFFESLSEVPRAAVTMGIGTIMRAKKILLAISGENKKEIARAAICGPVTPQVPASVLQLHPDVTVILDEAAAALL